MDLDLRRFHLELSRRRARGATFTTFDEVDRSSELVLRLTFDYFLGQRGQWAEVELGLFNYWSQTCPKDTDAIDRLEAIEKAKKSFYRLIWDYAAGNPGVALHMWRRCLAVSEKRYSYMSGCFHAPQAEDLQELPDNAAFVLRAIVQLGDASCARDCSADSTQPASH
ncbi:MAG: hypothetical protein U5M51_11630 [Emticicia sp.]|nr:hypothetical protein [Emticicia sp.]